MDGVGEVTVTMAVVGGHCGGPDRIGWRWDGPAGGEAAYVTSRDPCHMYSSGDANVRVGTPPIE